MVLCLLAAASISRALAQAEVEYDLELDQETNERVAKRVAACVSGYSKCITDEESSVVANRNQAFKTMDPAIQKTIGASCNKPENQARLDRAFECMRVQLEGLGKETDAYFNQLVAGKKVIMQQPIRGILEARCGGKMDEACLAKVNGLASELGGAAQAMQKAYVSLGTRGALAKKCQEEKKGCVLKKIELGKPPAYVSGGKGGNGGGGGGAKASGAGGGGDEDSKEAGTFLSKCFIGDNAIDRATNFGRTNSEVCELLNGTGLELWDEETLIDLAKPDATTYFKMLRRTAITRLMEAHRQLLGEDFKGIPPGCERFWDGIERFKKTPITNKAGLFRFSDLDPKAVQSSALIVARNSRKIAQIQSDMLTHWDCNGESCLPLKTLPCNVMTCTDNATGNQKIIDQLSLEIAKETEKHPFLAVGREQTAKLGDAYPEADALAALDGASPGGAAKIRERIKAAKEPVSDKIVKTISSFCRPAKSGGVRISHLLLNDALTSSIPKEFDYSFLLGCAKKEMESKKKEELAGAIGMGVLCLGGSFTPAAVVMGPACALHGSAKAISEHGAASDKLAWVNDCRNAAGVVCSTEDEFRASHSYQKAVDNLEVAIASAGLELTFGALRIKDLVKTLRARGDVLDVRKEIEALSKLDPKSDEFSKRLVALEKQLPSNVPAIAPKPDSAEVKMLIAKEPGTGNVLYEVTLTDASGKKFVHRSVRTNAADAVLDAQWAKADLPRTPAGQPIVVSNAPSPALDRKMIIVDGKFVEAPSLPPGSTDIEFARAAANRNPALNIYEVEGKLVLARSPQEAAIAASRLIKIGKPAVEVRFPRFQHEPPTFDLPPLAPKNGVAGPSSNKAKPVSVGDDGPKTIPDAVPGKPFKVEFQTTAEGVKIIPSNGTPPGLLAIDGPQLVFMKAPGAHFIGAPIGKAGHHAPDVAFIALQMAKAEGKQLYEVRGRLVIAADELEAVSIGCRIGSGCSTSEAAIGVMAKPYHQYNL